MGSFVETRDSPWEFLAAAAESSPSERRRRQRCGPPRDARDRSAQTAIAVNIQAGEARRRLQEKAMRPS